MWHENSLLEDSPAWSWAPLRPVPVSSSSGFMLWYFFLKSCIKGSPCSCPQWLWDLTWKEDVCVWNTVTSTLTVQGLTSFHWLLVGIYSPPTLLASLTFLKQVTCMPTEAWNVFPEMSTNACPPPPSFLGLVLSFHSGLCFSDTLPCPDFLPAWLTSPHTCVFFIHSLPCDSDGCLCLYSPSLTVSSTRTHRLVHCWITSTKHKHTAGSQKNHFEQMSLGMLVTRDNTGCYAVI